MPRIVQPYPLDASPSSILPHRNVSRFGWWGRPDSSLATYSPDPASPESSSVKTLSAACRLG
jgi:hypothetical protein